MMCKVSIIIGVFNEEKTISRCIDSIFKQEFKNFEIVICDDCSTDNTLAILNKYVILYPNIITIIKNSRNKKLAASLNNCVNNSKGEYIARIDADDFMYPDRLYKQIQFLDLHPEIDCIGSNMDVFDGLSIVKKQYYPSNPNINTLIIGDYPFAHPSIMIRKKCLLALGGYCEDPSCYRCEDLDLWYRFFSKGFTGYNIQECLTLYTETKNDYKKRSFHSSLLAYKLRHRYRKLLFIPWYYDFKYIKSLLFSALPGIVKYSIKRIK